MVGLAVQNFLSAAVGMAVLIAVIRGIISRGGHELGNFWVDLTRSLLYILLPLSILGALFLVSQGVVQTLGGYLDVSTLAGGQQGIAVGPAASQIAIKQLGTNGGGFFSVNSSMPFENPTALSNFVEVIFILLIPAALTATFGKMVGSARQGWAIFVTMLVLLAVGIGVSYAGEQAGSPAQDAAGISATAHGADSSGGNLEGKEQRFGIASSTEWATVTTAASNGSVNSALDSYTGRRRNGSAGQHADRRGDLRRRRLRPLRDAAVRPARGLHRRADGRPDARVPRQEDRGQGDQARDDRDPGRAAARARADGGGDLDRSTAAVSIYNNGPQGFSETLYAYGSQANNNGSAFAGFTGFVQPNAPGNVGSFGITFADLLGGFAMLIGRFVPLLAALAVAGSLAGKRIAPAGPGTLRTDNGTFVPAADLRDRRGRGAHVLPGTAARSDRAGPDREVVLMRRDLRTGAAALLILTVVLGFGYSLALTGISQAIFGNQADGSLVTERRSGRRLEAARPGLLEGPRLLPEPSLGHRLHRRRHLLHQPRPEQPQARPATDARGSTPT